MNTINYYNWQKIYNDLAYTFGDLVSDIKYGDEKMDIEKIKKEINDIKDIDSLEDLLAEMRIKIEKCYDEREEKIVHTKFIVDKNLKEKFFTRDFSTEIDNIDFRILIKNFNNIINDIAEIITLVKSVNYEISNFKLNSDGLLLIFIEKQRVV